MLNKIWFWLLFLGIVYGPAKVLVAPWLGFEATLPASVEVAEDATRIEVFKELGKNVTNSAIDGAKAAVTLCLGMIAIYVFWLGILQVAEDAGLVDALAWVLRPMMRWLFPEVPDGHPAQGAMLMNISANMLNLSNAATPFGLRAMQELQELNSEKETASNSMATFLAINTSSVTIVPFTIIGLRSVAGSEDPAAPVFGILLATLCSTCVAIFVVRLLAKLPVYAATAPAPLAGNGEEA